MRIKVSHLILPALIVMFLTGCSKKKAYTDVIPADCEIVISFDVKSLLEKSGGGMELYGNSLEMLRDLLDPETMSYLEKILNDPSESGISANDKMYLIQSPSLNNPVLVAKISDTGKLEKTIQLFEKTGVASPTKKGKGGYTYRELSTFYVAYNDVSLLIGNNYQNESEEMGRLLRYEHKENIRANKELAKVMDDKGDILCYFTQSAFMDNFKAMMPAMGYTGMYWMVDVNFEKGKIAAQFKFRSEDKETEKRLEAGKKAMGTIDGDFLPYFPISTPIFYATNFNGEKLRDLDVAIENPALSFIPFPMETLSQIKELMYSVHGDVTVAVTGISLSSNMPEFVVYGKSDKEPEFPNFGRGISTGYKDGYFYITNNSAIAAHPGKTEGQSLEQARYRSHIKGNVNYGVVDINALLQMPIVQIAFAFGGAPYEELLSRFSYLEFYGDAVNEIEMNLVFTDEETNALRQLVDIFKRAAGLGM